MTTRPMKGAPENAVPMQESFAHGSVIKMGRAGYLGTDKYHIGVVEYFYGHSDQLARVESLCGLVGKMTQTKPGKTREQIQEILDRTSLKAFNQEYECKTCAKVWEKRYGNE